MAKATKLIVDGFPYFAEHSLEDIEKLLIESKKEAPYLKMITPKTYTLRFANLKLVKFLDVEFEFDVPEDIPFHEYLSGMLGKV
jgi:hypothetical protein